MSLFLPTPSFIFHGICRRGVGTGICTILSFFLSVRDLLCPSFVISLMRIYSFLGQAWAEGKGKLATCRYRADSRRARTKSAPSWSRYIGYFSQSVKNTYHFKERI